MWDVILPTPSIPFTTSIWTRIFLCYDKDSNMSTFFITQFLPHKSLFYHIKLYLYWYDTYDPKFCVCHYRISATTSKVYRYNMIEAVGCGGGGSENYIRNSNCPYNMIRRFWNYSCGKIWSYNPSPQLISA